MLSLETVEKLDNNEKFEKLKFIELKVNKNFLNYEVILKNDYIDELKKSLYNKKENNPPIKGILIATIPSWGNKTIVILKERKSITLIEEDGAETTIDLRPSKEIKIGKIFPE